MATVTKDFKVKNGLVVEGTTATVNNYDVLTKKQDDQDYIVGLIGGTSTSQNTPDTVVKRDENGDFAAGEITADLVGDVTGQVSDISNHSTSNLSEGSNLYFTNQRAIDAQAGLWDEAGSAQDALNSANNYTNGEISSAIVQAQGYADSLASNYDPAGSAQGAYDNAVSAAASDATTKANNAENNAKSYADDLIEQEVSDRDSAISTAITNLNLAGTYDALGAADAALSDANDYTDQKVADLVDSAPALLDTLNELAAAIADNPNYASDVANLVATKADTSYVDSEISDLDTAAQGYASTAQTNAQNYADTAAGNAEDNANSYTDNAIINLDLANTYDALGAATTAQNNAATYTDNAINALSTSDIEEGTNLYFTNQRAIDAVGGTISDQINLLSTDDIEEGESNLYFTNARVENAIIDPLTLGTQTNISVTYNNGTGAYDFVAENGVADSTTDDLEEGENNLYFTDERAIDALSGVTIWPEAVVFNNLAKQVAATTEVATASTITAYSWAKADYRTAKFLVKTAYGTHTDVAEVLLTLDTSDNIAITEYAMVGTNGSAMTISADVSGNDVRLRIATVNNNSTVTVVGTLLA
jgi:hypothetical protein